MKTKVCSDCGKRKVLNSFYNNAAISSGKDCYCKVCKDVRSASYRKTDTWKLYIKNYMTGYRKTPKGKKYFKEYSDAWYKAPTNRMYRQLYSMYYNDKRREEKKKK